MQHQNGKKSVFSLPQQVARDSLPPALRPVVHSLQLSAASGRARLWGDRVIVLGSTVPSDGCNRLRLCSLQDTYPLVQHTLDKGRAFDDATQQLSAGGKFLAILTGTVTYLMPAYSYHLAVICLATGSMRSYPLLTFQSASSCVGLRVLWSPDNRAVLVTDELRLHHEVIGFGAW